MRTELPTLPFGWCWATPDQLKAAGRYVLGIGPFGSGLKVSDYRESGVPLVFVRNIRAESFGDAASKFVCKTKADVLRAHWVYPGDLLITKMGDPPGDACLYPYGQQVGVITADCIRLRIHAAFPNPRFFVYAIRSQLVRGQVLQITRGVAQRKVSLGRFAGVNIPVPPAPEQSRIVDAIETQLTRLDAAVAAL